VRFDQLQAEADEREAGRDMAVTFELDSILDEKDYQGQILFLICGFHNPGFGIDDFPPARKPG
jgi:hypothetical protein